MWMNISIYLLNTILYNQQWGSHQKNASNQTTSRSTMSGLGESQSKTIINNKSKSTLKPAKNSNRLSKFINTNWMSSIEKITINCQIRMPGSPRRRKRTKARSMTNTYAKRYFGLRNSPKCSRESKTISTSFVKKYTIVTCLSSWPSSSLKYPIWTSIL